MKTSKLYELAEKNPDGLRFTRKGAFSSCTFKFSRSGELECEQYPDRVITPYLTDEWELVQEPVDFTTAVKAYAEGKTIRCELEGEGKYIYETRCKDYAGTMKDENNSGLSAPEILRGKWYIEQ